MIQLLNWRYVRQHGEITMIAYRMESELSLAIEGLCQSGKWTDDWRTAKVLIQVIVEKWAGGE